MNNFYSKEEATKTMRRIFRGLRATFPFKPIRDLIGRTNSATIFGKPPESLVCGNPSAKRNPDGTWDVTVTILERDNWNKLDGKRVVDKNGNGLYQLADFSFMEGSEPLPEDAPQPDVTVTA